MIFVPIALGLAAAIGLGACAASPKAGQSSAHPVPSSAAPGSAVIAGPSNGSQNAPTGTTISVRPGEATSIKVALADKSGVDVPLVDGYDQNTKIPAHQLAYGTTYTASVTSTAPDGKNARSTSTFTTAAAPASSKLVGVRSNIGSGQQYGTAVPVVLTFTHKIAKSEHAAVQKRLSVTSSPSQPGTWNWFSDSEVHYRPKDHWQPGTKLTVNARLGGVALGNGYVGRTDLTVNTAITTSPLAIEINTKTHELTATKDGVVRQMPASNGKPSTPSSSGNMVIMVRHTQEIFDSSLGGGTPVNAPGGYRELVHWTMRLTWGGEFIHAAPWSVKSQGKTNVSHGCTNVSTANAKWIYDNSHVGDPVTVTGSPRTLKWGNGWSDWDRSWTDYVKGSALPAQA